VSESFAAILKAKAPLTLSSLPTGFLPWFAADLARAVHGSGKVAVR
jgi:transcription-repair coupling factor (superfamily II helicase)